MTGRVLRIDGIADNPLRVWTYEAVRDVLKDRHGIIFLYPNKAHGEDVTLKN
ncbi:hypothetical protein [Nitrobacter hamburgensis]|uniref:hypothetical protein n=1 Tax=Nitrobacter hamburgensis TaxID=912 RepID=UPI0002EC43D2|nr:hypothetical protein [Nitrobacter hamburgensis]